MDRINKRLVSDAALSESYAKTRSVRKTGAETGICGQSVHERLAKLGLVNTKNVFTGDDDERLRREYIIFRDAGRLEDLARLMGRAKPFICRQAKRLGLTNKNRTAAYSAVWKYMSGDAALVIFEDFKASRLGLGKYCREKGYDDLGFSSTMKLWFSDEWDHVIELKAPRSSFYRLGRALEYRVRDALRAAGYVALRSPASKSPVDIMAVRTGAVLFVQCKRDGVIGVSEWNTLYDLAVSVSAIPVLASSPGRTGIEWRRMVGRKDGSRKAQPMVPFDPSAIGEPAHVEVTVRRVYDASLTTRRAPGSVTG